MAAYVSFRVPLSVMHRTYYDRPALPSPAPKKVITRAVQVFTLGVPSLSTSSYDL